MGKNTISETPFTEFRRQCRNLLVRSLEKISPELTTYKMVLDIPPNPQFGELTSLICFEISKYLPKTPLELAKQIETNAKTEMDHFPLVESIESAGQGYVNFHADFAELSSLAIKSARALDFEYGYVKTSKPERIIVEHTSVNPVHPIHVGSARNSFLGDSIARILRARGHIVSRHYYIDDVGRQSAIVAYGYKLLGKPKPLGKPDHFIGAIYAITNCLLEIRRLKNLLEKWKNELSHDEEQKIRMNLDDWVATAVELQEKFPDIFNNLLETFERIENPESEINELMKSYEKGREEARMLIREVSSICLDGFKQTLEKANISFDSWDWESNFIWNGDVERCLNALKRTPYVFHKGEVLEFDAEGVAKDLGLKELLGLKENYEIPSLTLGRSDGTTLYTTRDIAYSIWKFKMADRVINVIGMEQKLAQLQLKLALYALGYMNEAKRLVHFAYNLVNFPGQRISGRRGRYITLDEVIEEATSRAYEEVRKRSTELGEEEKRRISEQVGIGAVKYALVETDPSKPVIFTWDRVINFERNSGPYIQYTHARACSILKKASRHIEDADFSLLKEPIEHEIVLMVSRFPEIFVDAADNLKPNIIADFINTLADKFNTFYAALPVVKAETQELSDARLLLVDAVRITLRNALNLIGIEAPQRM
ncbi:arginine--tRNA ligase [Candidatus Bathyarchaeota archaeon]|nr:arginine--tRNA ligase [Candidatus Bathyarchaeota archaeon]